MVSLDIPVLPVPPIEVMWDPPRRELAGQPLLQPLAHIGVIATRAEHLLLGCRIFAVRSVLK